MLTSGPGFRERVDAFNDAFQLDGRQGGVDGQGQHLVGGFSSWLGIG